MTTIPPNPRAILAAIAIAFWAIPGPAAAQDNASDPSSQPVLPDPTPHQGVDISPQAVTAVTAYGGPAKEIPLKNCSPVNPCALASSNPRKTKPHVPLPEDGR